MMNSLEDIRCEIIPVPTSSPDDPSKHALFFHRFREQDTESAPGSDTPGCSTHNRNLAPLQCMYCVKNGFEVKQCYHQSHKCFHGDAKHSFELVSWFDERIEVVWPTDRNHFNRVNSPNIIVPLADNVGFSFKLGQVVDHPVVMLFAKDVTVADLSIQRLNLAHRCVTPHAELKKFEKLGITNKISRVGSLTVLSYNILSDIYLFPERRVFCPPWALTWEYRRRNLLHEIIIYDADIVCLQEVQSDHFENYFKPELARFGYSAVYKKKTQQVFTGNGYTIDGCATFFRSDMFKQVIAYELEYNTTAWSLIWKLEPIQRDEASVHFSKGNIALVVILEILGDDTSNASSLSQLCVVNTHIYASKDSPDVKLLQVSDLISEIGKIIDPRMPLFICGDINSTPESDPYILIVRGEVNPACGEDTVDPYGIYRHLKLRHSFKLASAYTSAYVKPAMGCRTRGPSFTSLTSKRRSILDCISGRKMKKNFTTRRSTLDYIFYTVDSLEVEGLLELLDIDSLGRAALPSPLWSSDHIALMASFRISKPFLR